MRQGTTLFTREAEAKVNNRREYIMIPAHLDRRKVLETLGQARVRTMENLRLKADAAQNKREESFEPLPS